MQSQQAPIRDQRQDRESNRSEINANERVVGLTTAQRKSMDLSSTIQGWGADLDPQKRPGVPMDKAPFAGAETLYPDIEQQLSKVEILRSIEHKKMPPVFGTTCPPKGVSGMLRRFAFQSSEGQLNHWLTLLMADRVDMIEHTLKDLATGHIPNLYKEMGLAAEWKHNRPAFIKRIAITGVALTALTAAALYVSDRRKVTPR